MTNKKLVGYPRGFVGYDTDFVSAASNTNSLDSILTATKLNKTIEQTNKNYSINSQVELVWKTYATGIKKNPFEMREEIISAALTAFGTSSFYEWCKLQQLSDSFTQMHKRFLNDTFTYLLTGHRTVNIISWQSLIKARELNNFDLETPYEFEKYFKIESSISDRRSFMVSDTIVTWCQQPSGFEDLTYTLHILFGNI